MSSWRECKLGDVAKLSKKSWKVGDEQMPYIGLEHIEEAKLRLNGIGNSDDVASNKFRFQAGDTLFGKLRPYFRKVVKPDFDGICSTDIWVINPQKGIDKDFLFYFFANKELVDISYSASGGTRMPRADWDFLSQTLWNIPPLEEQKAIAEVLSSLDDKIDLLHRQNHTLESLAQTLFRQWFEDKEYDGIVGNITKLQSGYAFKSKDFQDNGNNRVLKIKNISNSIIDIFNTDFIDSTVTSKTDEKFKIFSGDILFGMTGAEIGKMGIVPQNDKNLWLNQRVGVLREKYLGAKYLAYLQITSEFGYDYIINTASGSAQPNISANEIEQCPFVKLTNDEIKNYSHEITPLFEKIIFNLGQIQTLENLRDTLLPKLLSGEVRVEI